MKCENCNFWEVVTPPAIGICNNKQGTKFKKTMLSNDSCNLFSEKIKYDMPEGFQEIFGGFRK
jgi:hypothetical protein